MHSPWVQLLGAVEDVHGNRLAVGVDYDGVTIGGWTFSREQREHMDRLLSQADVTAGENAELMREAAGDGV
jgi:hypothetical protein